MKKYSVNSWQKQKGKFINVTKHQEELKRARQRRRTSGAKLGDMDARGNFFK